MIHATVMKSQNGTVAIEGKEGRLRVRLPRYLFEGKQKYVSLLMDDTPANRQKARRVVQSIEDDISFGTFDKTLERYRPKNSVGLTLVGSRKNLQALYGEYVEYKLLIKPDTSPCTIRTVYNQTKSTLSRCEYVRPEDAQRIKEWCLEKGNHGAPMSRESTRRFLVQLGAACKHGLKKGNILSNPFLGMVDDLTSTNKKDEEDSIQPFSKDEKDKIIEAFRESSYYKRYASFIEFLFLTGCRPSEAVALQVKHVGSNVITFEQAIVPTTGKSTVLKEGLKRQSARQFPMNEQLRELMKKACAGKKPESFLFLGARGKYLDVSNFSQRGWKHTLEKLPIKYRNLYQTRHTAITMMVEAGVPVAQVAKWVGNSSEIIMRHYLGFTNKNLLPPAM